MELSIPAGDFTSAILALKNGADSVYFGLEFFSARAGADNFSIEDYRRLRKFALDNGKKIYIAINTIIPQELIKKLFSILSIVNFYGTDGVIVQDWGVVNLIKKHFPTLALHASTQMAVQNSDGVRVLKAMGFERVVLARELSLAEIKSIRDENPDIELKVFVHGAMCYCISGLCFASRFLLGKGSANRGTCAQVCRMNFRTQGSRSENVFSLKDLCSGKETIDALRTMGIDSIKVEGRLKGAAYSLWASKYYRAILDGRDDDYVQECLSHLKSAFSRQSTGGYLASCEDIYQKGYSGHRGQRVAVCCSDGLFCFDYDMLPHDGIMLMTKSGDAVKKDMGMYVRKGDKVALNFKGYRAAAGDELYRIKNSRDNIACEDKSAYPLYKRHLDIEVKVGSGSIALRTFWLEGRELCRTYDYDYQPSRTPQDIHSNFSKVFSRQGECFTLGSIDVRCDVQNPFIPSSFIKKIAIDFYAACDREADEYFSTPYPCFESDRAMIERDFKARGTLRAPSVVIGSIAPDRRVFENDVVEINNISQIANILGDDVQGKGDIKGVVLGPYFNIANAQGLEFFYNIFSDKLKGVYVSPELEGLSDFGKGLINDVKYSQLLPMFIHRRAERDGYREVYLRDFKKV